MTDHVAGTLKETVERKAFQKRKQQLGKSFYDFFVLLCDLVRTCNYCSDACADKAICEQIIKGICDDDIIEQLLHERKLTLENTVLLLPVLIAEGIENFKKF